MTAPPATGGGPFGRLRRFWRSLGPGVVAGAADDDPSGIATYSIAGAQLGTTLLWTAFLTWPLMAAVQSMCARIGMVTGDGLMAALRTRFPRSLLVGVAGALFLANALNIGADLAAMADAVELLTGVNSHVWVVAFAVGIVWATVFLRYATIANVLKWLALVLLAYVIAMFEAKPDWGVVARAAFVPAWPEGRDGWATIVALLGTTISPYLFFWQASQEVEEEKSRGLRDVRARRGATLREIRDRKVDIAVGTFASNAVMFAIILTTALTLHAHGLVDLQTSREVAQALEPLAGRFAALLYTLGIIGTGLLAIPTLAGSAAYAFAEVFGWTEGMDERPRRAPSFYGVVAVAVAAGLALDFLDVSPIRALFWSAVVNGVLAPVLLAGILLVASDRAIMAGQPSSPLGRVAVGATALLMAGAAVAMFVL